LTYCVITNLFLGTEDECANLIATIENNLENISNNKINSTKNKEKQPIQSTITVGSNGSEEVVMDDDQDDDNNSSQLGIMDDEEEEVNSSMAKTTTTSTSPGLFLSLFFGYLNLLRLESTSVRDKRPREECTSKTNKRKKHSSGLLTVPYNVFSAKEKECLSLQAKVARYEQEYMRK
jgi:hypothetical protein